MLKETPQLYTIVNFICDGNEECWGGYLILLEILPLVS